MPTPGPKPTASTSAPGPRASSSTAANSMSRFIRAMTVPVNRPTVPSKPVFALRTLALKHLK